MPNSFAVQAKVASLGYHVYKETTWKNAMENEKSHCCNWIEWSFKTNRPTLLRCSDQIWCKCCDSWSHIQIDSSTLLLFIFKEEQGEINDKLFGTTYRPSPIQSDGLQIPLVFQFQSPKYVTHYKMKRFVQTLYNYRYTGTKADSSN